ncbi:MAG: ABC transporter ATP-binding protein [Planctomycetes bacterium]|nr:ABC transporter ATP-binding protein [Planctomycetota bacterium]
MSDAPQALLGLDRLTYGFPLRPDFLKPVLATMNAGECWAIVGPNGAGKSTLLRLAAGLRSPSSGRVLIDGSDLRAIPPRELARRLAFLPQNPQSDFPLPVADVVLMGRFPHRRFGLFENAADRMVADEVMALTQTRQFADRTLSSLSGGEAQRVHVASALAQQPSILLLDEPTAALDLQYQLSIFELVRTLAVERQKLVVVVTHDLNLAARFCTHILLLHDGRCIATGTPADVLKPSILEPVYGVRMGTASTADGTRVLVPQVSPERQGAVPS